MAKDDRGPRAFSIRDVCARTGLGRTTVYAAIKSGALKARKCGRRTVVVEDDLSAFLNNLPNAVPPSRS
jgi:excisionase family DNA binding protein